MLLLPGANTDMEKGREMRLQELKERVERGDYAVEDRLVAEAIIERLRRVRECRDDSGTAQSECSYPDSVAVPAPKSIPGSPGTTRPTHVRDKLAAAAGSLARVLGGMQTTSS
jgi:hypothetical protein